MVNGITAAAEQCVNGRQRCTQLLRQVFFLIGTGWCTGKCLKYDKLDRELELGWIACRVEVTRPLYNMINDLKTISNMAAKHLSLEQIQLSLMTAKQLSWTTILIDGRKTIVRATIFINNCKTNCYQLWQFSLVAAKQLWMAKTFIYDCKIAGILRQFPLITQIIDVAELETPNTQLISIMKNLREIFY